MQQFLMRGKEAFVGVNVAEDGEKGIGENKKGIRSFPL